MANAPYEVNVSGTDDETFLFAIPFENEDGTAFPFDSYAIEYVVAKSGHRLLHLTQENGISIDGEDVVFRADRGSLRKGEYQHGCRIKHLITGDEFQVFDGAVVIGEGHFS